MPLEPPLAAQKSLAPAAAPSVPRQKSGPGFAHRDCADLRRPGKDEGDEPADLRITGAAPACPDCRIQYFASAKRSQTEYRINQRKGQPSF
jgi:hypothetical protein